MGLVSVAVYGMTGYLVWRRERYAIDMLGLALSTLILGTLLCVPVWWFLT